MLSIGSTAFAADQDAVGPGVPAPAPDASHRGRSIVVLEDSTLITQTDGPGSIAETHLGNIRLRARDGQRTLAIVNGRVVTPGGAREPLPAR